MLPFPSLKGRMAQMLVGKLKQVAAVMNPWIRTMELGLVQLVVAITLFSSGVPATEFAVAPHILFTETDRAEFSGTEIDTSNWRSQSIYEIANLDGVAWLRWSIPADSVSATTPIAIHTSGPFSADIYWNGQLIGQKGRVGATDDLEQAGPIDGSFAIPDIAIAETTNTLAMRISSTRAGYTPAAIVQSLHIAPYQADARRPLRYYAPAILLFGTLLAIAVSFLILARSRDEHRAVWLVVAIAGLLLAIMAETSRAMINYPYDWHQARQAMQLVFITIFAGATLRFSMCRWPIKRRIETAWLVTTAAATLFAIIGSQGYDSKSSVAVSLILISAFGWLTWRALAGKKHALTFALGLSVLPLYALINNGDFLDRSIYALTASLFGYGLVRMPFLFALEVRRSEVSLKETFSVLGASKTIFVPTETISFLKAAGNYTEIHKTDGNWALDNRGLSEVLKLLPDRFMRIHRSYAVSLDMAETVTVSAGSRYRLALRSGVQLPVGRGEVARIRARMAATRTSH
jgi:hypothetical protein